MYFKGSRRATYIILLYYVVNYVFSWEDEGGGFVEAKAEPMICGIYDGNGIMLSTLHTLCKWRNVFLSDK